MQATLVLTSLGLAFVSWKVMPVGWIYLCLFVAGVARTFLWSASASFLPQLVEREEFPLAVNWSSSTFQFSAVIGPAAGGALLRLTAQRGHGLCSQCRGHTFLPGYDLPRPRPAKTGRQSKRYPSNRYWAVFTLSLIIALFLAR